MVDKLEKFILCQNKKNPKISWILSLRLQQKEGLQPSKVSMTNPWYYWAFEVIFKYEIEVEKVGMKFGNWKTHSAKNLKRFFLDKYESVFISDYSQELTPIEFFVTQIMI